MERLFWSGVQWSHKSIRQQTLKRLEASNGNISTQEEAGWTDRRNQGREDGERRGLRSRRSLPFPGLHRWTGRTLSHTSVKFTETETTRQTDSDPTERRGEERRGKDRKD